MDVRDAVRGRCPPVLPSGVPLAGALAVLLDDGRPHRRGQIEGPRVDDVTVGRVGLTEPLCGLLDGSRDLLALAAGAQQVRGGGVHGVGEDRLAERGL